MLRLRNAAIGRGLLFRIWLLIALVGGLLAPAIPPAAASGSRLNTAGNRAYIEWHDTATTAGILRRSTFKAYVQAGERIVIGSSAMGIGAGNVAIRPPAGAPVPTCVQRSGGDPNYGRINDRAEEVAGPSLAPGAPGYAPCIVTAAETTAAGSGVWEFDFISPVPNVPLTIDPPPVPFNAAWVQNPLQYWISAWEIGVYPAAGTTEIQGRVFASYLALNMGGNSSAAAAIGLDIDLFVLTNDGYVYRIDTNGIDPFGFIFFANAEGVTDANGQPIYRSVQLIGPPPNTPLPPGFEVHNPASPDVPAENRITHKLFFETPDPTMPAVAPSPTGPIWLLNEPAPPPTPQNPRFVGIEGTPGQAGTAPLGGNFLFEAPANTPFTLTIDTDRNGTFGDNDDRVFTGTTTAGTTVVFWDALDGAGNPVPAGPASYNASIRLFAGEVHFPLFDAEINPNGFILERLTTLNLPNEPDPFLIFYDDTYTYTGAGAYDFSLCAGGETPPPPVGAINGPLPDCYGTPPTPRSAPQGVSSQLGGHAFGTDTVPARGFGDRRVIDTWAYYPSTPIPVGGQILLAEAELAITKTVAPTPLTPGADLTYTVTVTNNGPSAAIGARVVDDVPSAVRNPTWTCSVAPAGGGNCGAASGSGYLIDTTVDLQPGASATYLITATLDPLARGTLENVATVRRPNDNTDPDLTNNIARSSVPIVAAADLELTKVISALPPGNVAGPVEFTLELRNRGPDQTDNVAVTDQLPAGLTLVQAIPSKGTYTPATGVWAVGTMARDEVATLVLRTNWNGAPVTNVAEVTGSSLPDPDSTPGNGVPGEDDISTATLPVQIADLELTKRASAPRVNVGANVTFTIEVTNRGPDPATGVRVSERLPNGLGFVSATPSQGTYDSASGDWIIGAIPVNGQVTLTLVAQVLGNGPFTNSAQVSASNQYDPDSRPNNDNPTEDDQDFATVAGDSADLSVTKTVDNPRPNVGNQIVYTVTVNNAGPSVATGVELTDRLPAGLEFVSATPSQGAYNNTTGLWTVGTLPVNADATLQITAIVRSAAPLRNTAEVTASDLPDPDSTPGNNDPSEDDQASVILSPRVADLSLTKAVDNDRPAVGSQVTFTITVTNNGPDAATGVEALEQLPAGLTYVSHVAAQGAYNPASGLWEIGALANGAGTTLQITALVTGLGPYTNQAEISRSNEFDPNSTPGNGCRGAEDDCAQVTIRGAQADLSVSKRANAPVPAADGTIEYTIGVHNAGPDTATGVVLTEQMPAGSTVLTSSVTQGAYDPATGIWTVGTVPVNGSAFLTVNVQLTGPGPHTNIAQITSSDLPDPDSTPGNNDPSEDDYARVTVPSGVADLRLTKEATALGKLTDGVAFRIVVTNDGPDAATGVVVNDRLPAGLSFVSASPTQGSYDPLTGDWVIGTLPNGASATLTMVALLTVAGDAEVTNTAQVSKSDQFDPDSTPNNNNPGEDDQASATVSRPTAITLLGFAAERAGDGVRISWTTGLEIGTQGFQLYRATSDNRAEATLITPTPITARGSANRGATYSFLDTSALPGVSYRYWLVELASDGGSEFGPITVGPQLENGGFRVFLPLIQR
jgi:uncharacterized repeat protein (TIGR01451 family)